MTTVSQAKQELWRRGELNWKLDPFQKDLKHQFESNPQKIQVVLCSRRLGKTMAGLIMAIELCLKSPHSIVKILAPTKIMIDDITTVLFPQILSDCPDELQPQNLKNKYTYLFRNGSRIQLAGTDGGHADKLRGSFAHLCIVDEAGMCNDLLNTVRSILIPTTLNTKGKILLLSTPPKEPDHDFMKFVEDAEESGTLIKKTIYDNPRIKQEEIDEIIAAYPGGVNNQEFRREFLVEIVKDVTFSVIPEWTAELEQVLVKDHKKPPFFDCYEAMDIGGRDLTVVLFGYYDFRAAKVIIEDELVFNFREENNTYDRFIKQLKAKEDGLWMSALTKETKLPYLRVSDINYVVTEELYKVSRIQDPLRTVSFQPTKKDDKEAAINVLKMMLSGHKIIIHPRCTTLIRHLRNVKWSKSRTERRFARSPDNGHYDAVDALIYLIRCIVFTKNPYPLRYDLGEGDLFVANPDALKYGQSTQQIETFRRIFNTQRHMSMPVKDPVTKK
jgi:Terminase large subunit, T4likevirus-type, N-terminal